MNKLFKIFLMIVVVCSSFSSSVVEVRAEARTLNDLYNELNELKKESDITEDEIANISAQISANQAEIDAAAAKIVESEELIDAKHNEIAALEVEKAVKHEEIKELLSYYQFNQTTNDEMEYVIQGDSIVDNINRSMNIDLLTEKSNGKILEFIELQILLTSEIENLNTEIENLEQLRLDLADIISALEIDLADLDVYTVSVEDQIADVQKQISHYEELGCEANEDFDDCRTRVSKVVPNSMGFVSPLEYGRITSNYGYDVLFGSVRVHNGLDMAGASTIYAAANGEVAAVGYDGSRGNYVYLHHYIDGTKYSTAYFHLKSRSTLKVGDIVTVESELGIVGNTGFSFGAHLHFEIHKGWYGVDHWSSSGSAVDPRGFLSYPGILVYWEGRNR